MRCSQAISSVERAPRWAPASRRAGCSRRLAPGLLVAPVGGDPEFRPTVHFLGADLDLEGFDPRSDDGGVQRLVEVELRRVDVVLEPALHRGPEGVHGPERRPAVLLGGHDNPDGHEVVDLVELLAPNDHLLVDAPEVLRPARDLRLDAGFGKARPHDGEDVGELDLAPRGAGCHHLGDLGETLWVQGLKGQVLELPLDLLDPQAMRQGGVDVAGLLGGTALLPLRHHRQGPHVVQPVRELYDKDPPVARHGDEHLAHGRCLLGLLRVETEPVELGDPVHDRSHGGAEFLLYLGESDPGVLNGVVQQRRGGADGVEAEIRDDRGDRNRVGYVSLTGKPVLALMGLGGKAVGAPHEFEVVTGAPGTERRQDALDLGRRRRDERTSRILGRGVPELPRLFPSEADRLVRRHRRRTGICWGRPVLFYSRANQRAGGPGHRGIDCRHNPNLPA